MPIERRKGNPIQQAFKWGVNCSHDTNVINLEEARHRGGGIPAVPNAVSQGA
jgi:hypothetical protein